MNLKLFSKPIKTFCHIQGVETEVWVWADYQPREPELNAGAYVEVRDVKKLQGESVLDFMLLTELEQLEDRLLAMAHDEYDTVATIRQGLAAPRISM